MLPSQTEYLAYLKAGRQPGALEEAKAVDKQSHATLNALRAQQSNMQCFDCTSVKPGWAVLPFGVFVCIDCAQCHRHLGRQISQTKAINTGTYLWHPHEIKVMQDVGNGVAARAFADCSPAALPPKPSRDAPAAQKVAYATAKYGGAFQPNWRRAVGAKDSAPAPVVAPRVASASTKPAQPPSCGSPVDLISFDDDLEKAPDASNKADVEGFFAQFGL